MAERRGILIFTLLAFLGFSLNPQDSWAAPSSSIAQKDLKKSPPIPSTPSAPPPLAPPPPSDSFRCQRFFVYKGETISCDSNIRLDGEKLRPIIKDVPAAVAELDQYQKNRLSVRNAAYLGTFGFVVALAGYFISNGMKQNGELTGDAIAVRNTMVLGGGAVAVGSFLYALSFIKTNERHLDNAVNEYNRARPDAPIQLQFSADIAF